MAGPKGWVAFRMLPSSGLLKIRVLAYNCKMEATKKTPEDGQRSLCEKVDAAVQRVNIHVARLVCDVMNRIPGGEEWIPYMGHRPKGDPAYYTNSTIDGIKQVGPNKPMGYYPLPYGMSEQEISALIDEYLDKGLEVTLHRRTRQLWVYDRVALQALLDTRRDVLLDEVPQIDGKPLTISPSPYANEFAWFVMETQRIPPKTRLFDLIADAFGDKNNPGRTDFKP